MSENPRISIVIPTCRRPQLLLECIESILRSDFTNFEILVVDQDPNQTLRSALSDKFNRDSRISYLFLAEAALDKARNIGVANARGEIIVFVDDDIEVDVGWLSAYADAFSRVDPAPGVVGGRLDGRWLSKKPRWLPEEQEYLLGIYDRDGELGPMQGGDLPIGANFAVLREVFDKTGKFDERIDYSYARRASMLAGGDSLFALKAKQANYAVYYQPYARAWHKIAKGKLTKRYWLKRNFWGGVTIVVVLYLSGSAPAQSFPGIIRIHLHEIGRHIWYFFRPKSRSLRSNITLPQAWMRLAGECAHSLGVIYISLKFLLTHNLP